MWHLKSDHIKRLTTLRHCSTGINFIHILRTHFLYESKLSSFSLHMFGFVIFGAKISYESHVRKTLMKLTAGRYTDLGALNFLMNGFILSSSQFTLLPLLPLKIMLDLKVIKIDSKIIISIQTKFLFIKKQLIELGKLKQVEMLPIKAMTCQNLWKIKDHQCHFANEKQFRNLLVINN